MKHSIFAVAVMLITLIFSVTALADYERVADNTVPAYHDSNLTQRTGNERVDRGDRVIVHQETDRAYEVTYPTSRGSKRRWVPKNIFNGNSQRADFTISSYNLTCPGNYQLRFRGKAWNANNYDEITGIHVYVGGGAGDGGQMIGEFRADGALHRFDATLNVPQNLTGNQLVVIYAVNGIESKELDRRNINILPNNQRANFQLAPSYELTSPANYQIRLRGRSWNASNMNEITGIHVYIGGGVGAGGQMIGEFRTDQNHNFDVTISTQNKSGNQLVVIYAVNGVESKELDRRYINVLPTPSNIYDIKVREFINHEWYKNDSKWGWDCAAYANEFTNFVFGKPRDTGVLFRDVNKIQAGDVVYLAGSPNHFVVVLYRNGNNLTTIEGNYSLQKDKNRQNPKNNKLYGKTIYSETAYTIENGKLLRNGKASKSFQYGYHFL